MLCRNCEADIAESAAFCSNCGTSTQTVASQEQNTPRGEDRSNANISAASISPRLSWRIGVSLTILFFLTGGGIAGYFYFANTHIDPAELSATISSKLAENGIVGLSVNVSNDRIATLGGEVEDEKIVETALGITESTKGVKGALSELTTLPPINEVEALLSQALRDQQLNGIVVSIDPQRVVTLAGSVSDEAMINIAMNTAAATPGLKGLTSQVQVIATTEIVSDNGSGPSVAAQDSSGSWSGQQGRGGQDIRIINNPRNPVADRRWLRN